MAGILSILIYLIVFSLSALCYFLSKKKELSKITRVFLLITSIMLVVMLSSLRYWVGTDYNVYYGMHSNDKWSSLKTYIETDNYEIGYFFINYIGRVNNSLALTLGLASLITTIFLMLGLKKFKIDSTLSYFVVLLTLFPQSLNLVRQIIALSILFYAFAFLYKKQYIKYILLVLLASSFHITAVLMIPLVLFDIRIYDIGSKFKMKKYIIPIVLLLSSVLVVIYFNNVIDLLTKISSFKRFVYLIKSDRLGENKDIILNGVLLLGILLFGYRSYSKKDADKTILIILIYGFILSLTGFYITYAKRISLYFELLYVVLIIKMIGSYKKKFLRYTFSISFLCYGLAKFIAMYYYLGNAELFPYVYKLFW